MGRQGQRAAQVRGVAQREQPVDVAPAPDHGPAAQPGKERLREREQLHDQPLLVEFSAAWCSDCRKLHGMKQDPALGEELGRWPKIVVNVGRFDRHRKLLASLGVESIAHWEVFAPSTCTAQIDEWPNLGERTLEVSSGEAKDLTPDVLARWQQRNDTETKRERTQQSFCVPKEEIAANDYDLSINRYKEIVYEEIEYAEPAEILDDLAQLETEIQQGIKDLKAMLE